MVEWARVRGHGEIELSAVKCREKLKPRYLGKSSQIELSPAPFLGVATVNLAVHWLLVGAPSTRTSQGLPLALIAAHPRHF